eukprot:scaffold189956_cov35-Tisochrysis_lutea.AAC.2
MKFSHVESCQKALIGGLRQIGCAHHSVWSSITVVLFAALRSNSSSRRVCASAASSAAWASSVLTVLAELAAVGGRGTCGSLPHTKHGPSRCTKERRSGMSESEYNFK